MPCMPQGITDRIRHLLFWASSTCMVQFVWHAVYALAAVIGAQLSGQMHCAAFCIAAAQEMQILHAFLNSTLPATAARGTN